ncbi:MAG: hypothetical protein ACREXT_13520 [Gammaproteobacteria bacterium]
MAPKAGGAALVKLAGALGRVMWLHTNQQEETAIDPADARTVHRDSSLHYSLE